MTFSQALERKYGDRHKPRAYLDEFFYHTRKNLDHKPYFWIEWMLKKQIMLLLTLIQKSPSNEREGKIQCIFSDTYISIGQFIYPRPVARSHQCSLLACKQPGLFPSPITEGEGGRGRGEGRGRGRGRGEVGGGQDQKTILNQA